jgi:hypothetical protein
MRIDRPVGICSYVLPVALQNMMHSWEEDTLWFPKVDLGYGISSLVRVHLWVWLPSPRLRLDWEEPRNVY